MVKCLSKLKFACNRRIRICLILLLYFWVKMAKFLPAASLTTNFVTRGYYSIYFNLHLFTWIVKFAKVKIQRRHIGHDAKFIRDIHGHQVARIQQGRDTKLFLCHFECLSTNKREFFTNWYLLQKKKAKGPVLGFLWDPLDVKRQGVLEKSTCLEVRVLWRMRIDIFPFYYVIVLRQNFCILRPH